MANASPKQPQLPPFFSLTRRKRKASLFAADVDPYEGMLPRLMARLDQLDHKLESLIDKVTDDEIARQTGNEPQTLRRHYKKRKLETVKATVKKLNRTQ